MSQLRRVSMLCVTCSTSLGSAIDELADHEGENPDQDGEPEDEDERDGAAARGAVPVEEVDRGQQHRRQHQGQRDGHDHDARSGGSISKTTTAAAR